MRIRHKLALFVVVNAVVAVLISVAYAKFDHPRATPPPAPTQTQTPTSRPS